ncbi:MAG: rubrerythrin [Chitinivibrionales bacterium]|nr:rubrerythrin [Chitinivibrionales bacterium]
MSIRFNADEIFEIAIKIENNGYLFYKRAGEIQDDDSYRAFFNDLASMEVEHKKIFSDMQKKLTSEQNADVIDPQGEAAQYLHYLADSHGGEGTPLDAVELDESVSVREIVRKAVEMEKVSILYYSGLKEMVPQSLGKDLVDRIITEERRHVAQLSQVLREMPS